MQSFDAIMNPLASAARHLAKAARLAREDFSKQAQRTRRNVSGELNDARDDLGEAANQFAESLDDARQSMTRMAKPLRSQALQAYEVGSKQIGSAFDNAADASKALARQWKGESRLAKTAKHPLVISGVVAAVGVFAYRAWRKRQQAKPAARATAARSATAGKSAPRTSPRKRKPAAGRQLNGVSTASTTAH